MGCHNWEWGITGTSQVEAGMPTRVPCVVPSEKHLPKMWLTPMLRNPDLEHKLYESKG